MSFILFSSRSVEILNATLVNSFLLFIILIPTEVIMRNLKLSGLHAISHLSIFSYHKYRYNKLLEHVINEEDGDLFAKQLKELTFHSNKCLDNIHLLHFFYSQESYEKMCFKYTIPLIIEQFILQDYNKSLNMSEKFLYIDKNDPYYYEAVNFCSKSLILLKSTLSHNEYIEKYGLSESKVLFKLKEINEETKGNGSLLELSYLLHLNDENKLSKQYFTRFVNTHGIEEAFDQAFGYGVNTWFYKNVEIFSGNFFDYIIKMAIDIDPKVLNLYTWNEQALDAIKKIHNQIGMKLENLQLQESQYQSSPKLKF